MAKYPHPEFGIVDVDAWEVLDSRGRPTVAALVKLAGGASGVASVPSGASVGTYEAHELRDGGERYEGRGVRQAVENVRTVLREAVLGLDASEQHHLDTTLREVDGTLDLAHLGANAVLAVSVAAALAAAECSRLPLYRYLAGQGAEPLLPLPMINIVSGGAHAGGAVDFQDVLAVPLSAESFAEAIEVAARVRAGTVEVASDDGYSTALVADEGGLGLPLSSNRAALELVVRGVERCGLRPGSDVGLAVDVAATQFYRAGRYALAAEDRVYEPEAWLAELVRWTAELPIVSIEDPMADEDWAGWTAATRELAGVQLLGDDLFVTSQQRLERGLTEHIANAVLVKPNQCGTLDAARTVVERARSTGYATVVSARSGETEDSWLADLAVGWRAGQIKVGSTTRSERTAKWNRLLRIEHENKGGVAYAGAAGLSGHVSDGGR